MFLAAQKNPAHINFVQAQELEDRDYDRPDRYSPQPVRIIPSAMAAIE
jgi:hypothetical protein